jgi:hypothetical protein
MKEFVWFMCLKFLVMAKLFLIEDFKAITVFSIYSGGLNHTSDFIKRELFEKYGFYDETFKIVTEWK